MSGADKSTLQAKTRATLGIVAGFALIIAILLAVVRSPKIDPVQGLEATPEEDCSSCTLRHQNLGKNEETRESEAKKLKELFENSKSDRQ